MIFRVSIIASTLFLSITFSAQADIVGSKFTSTNTPLNRCPTTDRSAFKREKSISEKCPAKEDFQIFIEGDNESTLKFVLEKEFKTLISDDPHTKRIRIGTASGGDDFLSGEVSGTHVNWVYKEKELVGIVLKRLVNDVKKFEAFRLVDNKYFCHLGGDKKLEAAQQFIENGKQCNA